MKKCPFCKSTDVFVERADYSSCFVMCNDCGARGPECCPEDDKDNKREEKYDHPSGYYAAIRAWNNRRRKERTNDRPDNL